MNEIAMFPLMLTGMLGYVALIGRVLRRRPGGSLAYQPAAIKAPRSAPRLNG